MFRCELDEAALGGEPGNRRPHRHIAGSECCRELARGKLLTRGKFARYQRTAEFLVDPFVERSEVIWLTGRPDTINLTYRGGDTPSS